MRAVLFREELARATVRPEHGMQVIVPRPRARL